MRIPITVLFSFGFALLVTLALRSIEAAEFRIGAVQVEITPEKGTPMAGGYKFRGVGGMLDPLYAKTIVMEQDGQYAVFVELDLAYTTRPLVEETRKVVQEQCGIEDDHVMISATHPHTGPTLPRGNLMDGITKADSPPGLAFFESLPGLIAKSVSDAKSKLVPAQPAFTVGDGKGICFNRRVLQQGSEKAIWQPKYFDPATMRPAGPVDPDFGVLVFHSVAAEPKPMASLLNFAMHPTSVGSGDKVSADYPGVFSKFVGERHGPGMLAVFANGCCGNTNPNDYFTSAGVKGE